jgi:hypothetical protein
MTGQDELKCLALKSTDMYIRQVAAGKIDDPEFLVEFVKNEPVDFIRKAAVERLNSIHQATA